jgi:hypothetical protein
MGSGKDGPFGITVMRIFLVTFAIFLSALALSAVSLADPATQEAAPQAVASVAVPAEAPPPQRPLATGPPRQLSQPAGKPQRAAAAAKPQAQSPSP